jgi:hypothetical protein
MNLSGNANTALIYLRHGTSGVNCVDAHESQGSGISCNVIAFSLGTGQFASYAMHMHTACWWWIQWEQVSVACKALASDTPTRGACRIQLIHSISLVQHISISSRPVFLCMHYLYFDLSSAG